MKQILAAMAALLTISMSACSQSKTTKENSKMEKKTTLVIYFSATGTTAKVATQIAKAANADLYEITPEKAYTDADLDWNNKQSRSSVEMADKSSRPAIKGTVENISQYDVVYLGFPIWWYQQPTIVNTFIEKNNLKGKTVKTFATSGGSNINGADKVLKKAYPDIRWVPGKLLNNPTASDIKDFIK